MNFQEKTTMKNEHSDHNENKEKEDAENNEKKPERLEVKQNRQNSKDLDWKVNNKNWESLKEKVKEKWDKLSHDEIDSLKDNFEDLVGLLEKKYGYAKERAEEEYNKFKSSVAIVMGEVEHNALLGTLVVLTFGVTIVLTSILTRMYVLRKHQS